MERPVFCFYQETTIDPKDMLQQINRNRNITKLYYLFQRKKCKNTDFNTLADAVDDTNNLKKWCEKNDHLHQEISRVHPIFQEVFNELKYNQDCYKSNPYAHFKKLLIERGFNDKTNIHQSISKYWTSRRRD
jgi:DNA mismatch repair ATPase MutS